MRAEQLAELGRLRSAKKHLLAATAEAVARLEIDIQVMLESCDHKSPGGGDAIVYGHCDEAGVFTTGFCVICDRTIGGPA
jgi:hypothetical protein